MYFLNYMPQLTDLKFLTCFKIFYSLSLYWFKHNIYSKTSFICFSHLKFVNCMFYNSIKLLNSCLQIVFSCSKLTWSSVNNTEFGTNKHGSRWWWWNWPTSAILGLTYLRYSHMTRVTLSAPIHLLPRPQEFYLSAPYMVLIYWDSFTFIYNRW